MGSLFDDVTALAHRDRFEDLTPENFSFPTRRRAPTAACCTG